MPGKYDVLQLAEEIRENRPGALERLLERYGSAILGYIRSRNLLSDADTEDIYQNTVIDIWKRIGDYRPEKETFLGFLLGIAGDAAEAYYQEMASQGEGSENDGYEYGDEDFAGEESGETDETGKTDEFYEADGPGAEAVFEFLAEKKDTPDYMVLNSPYLFEKYVLLLRTLMGEVLPLHQALMYAVLKLAPDAASNAEGPDAADLRGKTLFELLLLFKREYARNSGIPDAKTDDEIMRMFDKLNESQDGVRSGTEKLGDLLEKEGEGALEGCIPLVKEKIRGYLDEKFIEIFQV